MKKVIMLLSFIVIAFVANATESTYAGSTPVGTTLRTFFGIDLKDSIDFMRWKITLTDNTYSLQCNYGLSKSNTNGFINDGKIITQKGAIIKEKNYYQLKYDNKTLKIVEINSNLLQILSTDKNLLVGNAGWSYTLNNIASTNSDKSSIKVKETNIKDSVVFEGRTPCGVPGVIPGGKLCYKLKWQLLLYSNIGNTQTGMYKIFGTGYRKEGGRKGDFKIIKSTDGRIIYQLNDNNNNGFIYLLKLDENIIAFTDAKGNLLVEVIKISVIHLTG